SRSTRPGALRAVRRGPDALAVGTEKTLFRAFAVLVICHRHLGAAEYRIYDKFVISIERGDFRDIAPVIVSPGCARGRGSCGHDSEGHPARKKHKGAGSEWAPAGTWLAVGGERRHFNQVAVIVPIHLIPGRPESRRPRWIIANGRVRARKYDSFLISQL